MKGYGDERFRLGDTDYWFTLAPGGVQGFVSDSPFAPKTTTGERSYADYDVSSAVAFTELTGGMGQERATDVTRYYDARNADARGGRLILGPRIHYNAETLPGLSAHADALLRGEAEIGTLGFLEVGGGITKLAAELNTGASVLHIDRIWLALAGDTTTPTLTVGLYNDSGGAPGSSVATATMRRDDLLPAGGWVQASFSPTLELAASSRFWIVIEQAGGDGTALGWYGGHASETAYSTYHNARVWNGSAWINPSDGYWHLIYQYDDPTVRPDSSLRYVLGAGEDGILRVWGYSGRRLYYIGADGLPTAVQDGSGNVYQAASEIMDAVWYRSAGSAHPFLYLALGDTTDMVTFDGNIGAEQWSVVTGHQARKLALHDQYLWYADDQNMVGCTDGTNWGTTAAVGDKTYPIRNMVSWNGYLYVGKDDGLYRVTYPTGYPVSGTPTVSKVLDFLAMAMATNFSVMVEHQGDLIFSIGHGLLRFTGGGVLTPVSPDVGLERSVAERSVYRAAFSTINTLWVAAEGPLGGYSSLLAMTDWHWHPVVTVPRRGDMIRSLIAEPGIYGAPRLWFKAGLQVCYVNMPFATQKRWTWPEMDYAGVGTLDLSWVDGNIRTINKDWLRVELDVDGVGEGEDDAYVVVYWRPDDVTAWASLGEVRTTGISHVEFPAATYGPKLQLRIELHRGVDEDGNDVTPQVAAVVLKYMERPEDAISFTRTYLLSERGYGRGAQGRQGLAEQVALLRTFRESAEPLRFWPFWGVAADVSYLVHWVNYSATEQRAEVDGAASIVVTVKMQVVS